MERTVQPSVESLIGLLRCKMTAVNQQFTHILSLRARGDRETAARIEQVDNVDFVNAMRIIDHLVANGVPIELEPGLYVTGCARTSMLFAEQAMESRMAAAIAAVACEAAVFDRLVAPALAPRADYARWLSGELETAPPEADEEERFGEVTFDLCAHALALMEQSLVHAFLHRQAADLRAADASWATSGAAMMHLTSIVRLLTGEGSTPFPGTSPRLNIAHASRDAPELERELAAQTAEAARQASRDTDHPGIATLCRDIAGDCDRISAWSPGAPHPAQETNPPAFHSFDKTCARFLSSEGTPSTT